MAAGAVVQLPEAVLASAARNALLRDYGTRVRIVPNQVGGAQARRAPVARSGGATACTGSTVPRCTIGDIAYYALEEELDFPELRSHPCLRSA